MAQSVFVQKTSNYSRGRPNLRIQMNQVANLKSLVLPGKKLQVYWESPQVFYVKIEEPKKWKATTRT